MATYYIATTGNDTTGNGSSGNPWATFGKAHTAAASGDTIIVGSGTYTMETIGFTKNLTYTAQTSNAVTLEGSGNVYRWYHNAANSVILTITLNGINFNNIAQSASNSIFLMPNKGGTAYIDWVMNNCNLTNLIIDSNGGESGGVFGQDVGGGNGVAFHLTSCVIALSRKSVPTYTVAQLVGCRNNYVLNSSSFINCIFYASGTTSGTTLTHWFNGQSASGSAVLTIKNCIFASAYAVPYFYTSGYNETNTPAYNSCVYNVSSGAPTLRNSITSNPLFVDAAAGNFRLRPTSPCLNTGTAN